MKGFAGTLGPLTQQTLDFAKQPASVIPFLGCAAPGDVSEAVLTDTIPNFVDAGSRLCESFNDGPAMWDPLAMPNPKVTLMPIGTDVRAAEPIELPDSNRVGTPGSGGILWLQDQRDWNAWHGGAKKHCNILMADGSVKSVADVNGDGYLNPGFPVVAGTGGPGSGYLDGVVELPPSEIYSAPFLQSPSITKQNFE